MYKIYFLSHDRQQQLVRRAAGGVFISGRRWLGPETNVLLIIVYIRNPESGNWKNNHWQRAIWWILRKKKVKEIARDIVFDKCVIVWNRLLEFQYTARLLQCFFKHAIWNRIVRYESPKITVSYRFQRYLYVYCYTYTRVRLSPRRVLFSRGKKGVGF